MKVRSLKRIVIKKEALKEYIHEYSFCIMLMEKMGYSINEAHEYQYDITKVWVTKDFAQKYVDELWKDKPRIDAYQLPREDCYVKMVFLRKKAIISL